MATDDPHKTIHDLIEKDDVAGLREVVEQVKPYIINVDPLGCLAISPEMVQLLAQYWPSPYLSARLFVLGVGGAPEVLPFTYLYEVINDICYDCVRKNVPMPLEKIEELVSASEITGSDSENDDCCSDDECEHGNHTPSAISAAYARAYTLSKLFDLGTAQFSLLEDQSWHDADAVKVVDRVKGYESLLNLACGVVGELSEHEKTIAYDWFVVPRCIETHELLTKLWLGKHPLPGKDFLVLFQQHGIKISRPVLMYNIAEAYDLLPINKKTVETAISSKNIDYLRKYAEQLRKVIDVNDYGFCPFTTDMSTILVALELFPELDYWVYRWIAAARLTHHPKFTAAWARLAAVEESRRKEYANAWQNLPPPSDDEEDSSDEEGNPAA